MALEQLHVLLTYACNFECDHCFVYSGPSAPGTFTMGRMRELLDQAEDVASIEWVYFEGGEPFYLYPLLLESVKEARARQYQVGIVSNSYWADSEENARLWLEPLAEAGIGDLSVSDDAFHHGTDGETPAKRAMRAALHLGIPTGSITIDPPGGELGCGDKGEAVTGGTVRFRGRAVDRLADGLPRSPWRSFTECPDEELAGPSRVHVDPYGHLQVCQGISIGNVWETRLADIFARYQAQEHPICGPLLRGGPAALAVERAVGGIDSVDACHLCYSTRRSLLDAYPEELAPRQIYGLV